MEDPILKQTGLRTGLLSIFIVVFAFTAVTIFLAGCGSGESDEPGEPVAEAVELEPAAVEAAPTEEPTSTPLPPTPTAEPVEPDSCSDCHTDQELLMEVADPEEEVINENEGEG
jgi:hypothetical protein